MGHIIQSTLNNVQYAHALKRSACLTHELLLHVTSLQIGYYECSVVPAKVYFSLNTFVIPDRSLRDT